MENDRIQIAFTVDIGGPGAMQFCDQLVVALWTLRQTGDDIDATIFFGSAPTDLILKCQTFENEYFHLKFKQIDTNMMNKMNSFVPNQNPNSTVRVFSGITFLRFWLPVLMPKAKKIIYSDCDVLFRKSIRPLWETDFEGNLICAPFGSVPEHGYYSGCILINAEEFRNNKSVYPAFEAHAMQFGKTYKLPDQTTMNRVFAGKIKRIDSNWIYPPTPDRKDGRMDNAPVWHFYEGQKPFRIRQDDHGKGLWEWNLVLEEAESHIKQNY